MTFYKQIPQEILTMIFFYPKTYSNFNINVIYIAIYLYLNEILTYCFSVFDMKNATTNI